FVRQSSGDEGLDIVVVLHRDVHARGLQHRLGGDGEIRKAVVALELDRAVPPFGLRVGDELLRTVEVDLRPFDAGIPRERGVEQRVPGGGLAVTHAFVDDLGVERSRDRLANLGVPTRGVGACRGAVRLAGAGRFGFASVAGDRGAVVDVPTCAVHDRAVPGIT